jgi:hypothetical protein
MKTFTLCLVTGFLSLFFTSSFAQDNALNFDGINDRVMVPASYNYDYEWGTVEMWVRQQGLTGNACIIGNRGMGGTRWSFHMSNTQIGMYNGSFYSALNYTTTPGVWYHIAFTFNPWETNLYVNGNYVGQTTNVVMGWENNDYEWEGVTNQGLVIGAVYDNTGNYEYFKGDIDDIRVWDYQRDQATINNQKNSNLTGTEPGLVTLFKFDQGIAAGNNTAITLATESSQANDGTLVNFAKSGGLSNFIPRNTTLPVALTDFKASKQHNAVLLQWQTASEQNSASFIIERSADGKDFDAIGNVRAAGNSTTNKSYRYEDASPLKGNNYYRLKQVDADGKISYSDVRSINFATEATLSWYAQGKNAVVQLAGGANEQYIVSDMNGATAMQGRLQNGKLLIAGKTAGVYNVRVWSETGVKVIKVVIQ